MTPKMEWSDKVPCEEGVYLYSYFSDEKYVDGSLFGWQTWACYGKKDEDGNINFYGIPGDDYPHPENGDHGNWPGYPSGIWLRVSDTLPIKQPTPIKKCTCGALMQWNGKEWVKV